LRGCCQRRVVTIRRLPHTDISAALGPFNLVACASANDNNSARFVRDHIKKTSARRVELEVAPSSSNGVGVDRCGQSRMHGPRSSAYLIWCLPQAHPARPCTRSGVLSPLVFPTGLLSAAMTQNRAAPSPQRRTAPYRLDALNLPPPRRPRLCSSGLRRVSGSRASFFLLDRICVMAGL